MQWTTARHDAEPGQQADLLDPTITGILSDVGRFGSQGGVLRAQRTWLIHPFFPLPENLLQTPCNRSQPGMRLGRDNERICSSSQPRMF